METTRRAIDLSGGSGRLVFDDNTIQGIVDTSTNGILLTTASSPGVELLIRDNNVNNGYFVDHAGFTSATPTLNTSTSLTAVSGIEVTAPAGSRVLADSPSGTGVTGPTGVFRNVVQNSGDGIVMTALAGGQIDASVEDNESSANALNGFVARADGGVFNLASMRSNLFGGEDLNSNGRLDTTEDTNGDGVLDTGEDLDDDNVLDVDEDVNRDGVLDPGEDLNGNGVLDVSEDVNGDGILDPGEDLDADNILRPDEDVNGDGILASGNGANGAFLHYLNGGRLTAVTEDINEDLNFNGILDAGETLGPNGVLDFANGVLDVGEDINGNGVLDQGIVSNFFHNNGLAGLCIVGEGDSAGAVTIGGPASALGNQIYENLTAGIGVDLRNTATLDITSMSNTISNNAGREPFLTQVGASLSVTGDTFGAVYTLVNTSPVAPGTAASVVPALSQFTWNLDRGTDLQGWELDTEQDSFRFFGTPGVPFAAQEETELTAGLDTVNGVDFNNLTIFDDFFVQYPTSLDVALDGQQQLTLGFGDSLFSPLDVNADERFQWVVDIDRTIANSTESRVPDDTITADLLAGTTANVTFLADFDRSGEQTLETVPGVFVKSPTDPDGLVLQVAANIVSAGFNPDPTIRGEGIQIVARDESRITSFNSTNDISRLNKGNGITLAAHDSARVDELTIQGGSIERNGQRGINIEAHDSAVINADSTIGGYDELTSGQNLIAGTAFSEQNLIRSNRSDGIRVLAANGGTVNGNLINNRIESNGAHGASLIVDEGGTLNFGALASNQVISRNSIQLNDGAGIHMSSGVSPGGVDGRINALIRNNTISTNGAGGIISSMSGLGAGNRIDLTVGGDSADSNTINGNAVAGVSFGVAGNGIGNFSMTNSSVTGTTDRPDTVTDGHGIVLSRSDASLLTATLQNVSSTGNAGDGLRVEVEGSDKNEPTQPMAGTVNTVAWNNNDFSQNRTNGATFAVSGSGQLIADGENNILDGNGVNGLQISTEGDATFGDPTVGAPPHRRVILNGTQASNNGNDVASHQHLCRRDFKDSVGNHKRADRACPCRST